MPSIKHSLVWAILFEHLLVVKCVQLGLICVLSLNLSMAMEVLFKKHREIWTKIKLCRQPLQFNSRLMKTSYHPVASVSYFKPSIYKVIVY